MAIDVTKLTKYIAYGPTYASTAYVSKINQMVVVAPVANSRIAKINQYVVVGPPPVDPGGKQRRTSTVWMG